MGYRIEEFAPGEIYHVYTRGVERRTLFRDKNDHERFMQLLLHCLPVGNIRSYSLALKFKQTPALSEEGKGLVDILSYCLMTNHIHLLLKENIDGGISLYMQRVLNSYAKYFNMSNKRSGSLFTNPFRAAWVDSDEQFLHVTRYIHLNPYTANMILDPLKYEWSSLGECIGTTGPKTCHRRLLRSMMSGTEYGAFVLDQADYARSLLESEHLLIDYDA